MDENNAAESLVGLVVNDNWLVKNKIDKIPGGTGGHFSIRYTVEDKDGSPGFLKALNYKAFFNRSLSKDPVKVVSEQTSAFEFERAILIRCQKHKLSKIIKLLDEGVVYLDTFAIPAVPFLIFELTDGDIRSKIDFSNQLDILWKLKSLHDVAVGLKQLHWAKISHQDLKPSNILIQDNGWTSKIGDLGNSLCAEIKSPLEKPHLKFNGDSDYMPIEFFYKYHEPDWNKRVRSTDMYLFGNLVCYYFTGLNMTSLIAKNTDKQFRWSNWNGSYSSVRDHLMNGFYKAVKEFKTAVHHPLLKEELGIILEYCCYPYPEKRGHPSSVEKNGNQYDFERIITRLDVIRSKLELQLIRNGS